MNKIFIVLLSCLFSCSLFSFFDADYGYRFNVVNKTMDTITVFCKISSLTPDTTSIIIPPQQEHRIFSYENTDGAEHKLSKTEFSELLLEMNVYEKDSLIYSEIPGDIDTWLSDYFYDKEMWVYEYNKEIQ